MQVNPRSLTIGALVALTTLGCGGSEGKDSPSTEPHHSGLETGQPGPAIEWSTALSADTRGAWLSVWGSSADDVWIVGGQPDAGVVLRGSGTSFSQQTLPSTVPILNWVHGTGPDDVWVGGVQGTLLHFDGTAWTDLSLPVDEAIWGLYAVASDDVYAVGGTSAWGGDTAMAMHFDGAEWSEIPIPSELGGPTNLFKVHGVSATEIWMVGVGGVAMVGSGLDFAPAPTGVSADLVTANAAFGPLVVVGGRGTGVVMEGDGTGGLHATAQANAGLSGVMVYPSGVAVVVGELTYSGLYNIETDELVDVLGSTNDILHATWGTPGAMMYAVGGNLNTSEDHFKGLVLTATAPQ